MSDYLEKVEGQLSELTERGAHHRLRARRPGYGGPRRPRRRSEALAVLAAAAVVVAVVAIVLVNVHSGQPRRTSAAAPHAATVTTTPGVAVPAPFTKAQVTPVPLPTNFAPQSFTAISELTWWLLETGPCTVNGQKTSCAAILQTSDGGRSFTAVHTPAAPVASPLTATSGYSQLRFADAKNGFAFGPGLYVTHDGGASWHQLDVRGRVTDLAISAGEAYATVAPAGLGTGRLMHSPVGSDDWSALSAAGPVSVGLWVQGSEVIVQSGIGASMLVSHDAGASFATYPAPSPGFPCQFAAPAPPVVWADCPTGMASGVWRSTDGGAHFTPAASAGRTLPNSAQFAAASATTAVVGDQQLYRTADGGVTWTPVGPPGIARWAYLGFTDPTHGVALGYVGSVAPANERLYYTTDGGQSYHLVPLP